MPASPSNAEAPPDAPGAASPVALSIPALLVLLPAALPALGWLARSPAPEVEGAGLVLLAAVPAGLLALARAFSSRPGAIRAHGSALALLFGILLAAWVVGGDLDPFGARRARTLLSAGVLTFLGACALRKDERVTLVAGVAGLAFVYGLPALWLGATSPSDARVGALGWAGVLGNPGPLSQVLVPAGAVGLALLARVRGTRARVLGLAALAVASAHAALAPVHAGLVALVAAGLVVTLLSTVRASVRVVPFVLSLVVALPLVARTETDAPPTLDSASAPAANDPTLSDPVPAGVDPSGGGLAVRASLLRASLALWRAEGAVGLGRTRAALPPFREVEETERSRDGRCMGGIREVEHPHDDWLLGWIELGLFGGLAWLLLLATSGWRGLLALRYGTPAAAGLGAALVALLVNAFAHAPLLVSPASSALGFALLGAAQSARIRPRAPAPDDVRAEGGRARPRLVLVGVLALAALSQVPAALSLIRHGRALTEVTRQLGRVEELAASAGADAPGLAEPITALQAALDRALDLEPDASLALRLQARFAPAAGRQVRWEAVLEHQPHSLEALFEAGLAAANAGRDPEARAHWERALTLQPTHPILLRSLVRLAFHAGDDDRAEAWLRTVQAAGCLEPGWTANLGAELTLAGRPSGRSLLERDEPRMVGATAAWIDALGREARQTGDERRADALALIASRTWAREHAAAGRWTDAVRLYRQALNRSRRHVPEGGGALRLELGAAALRAGQEDVAREQWSALDGSSPDARGLPDWALDVLRSQDLLPEGSRPAAGGD